MTKRCTTVRCWSLCENLLACSDSMRIMCKT